MFVHSFWQPRTQHLLTISILTHRKFLGRGAALTPNNEGIRNDPSYGLLAMQSPRRAAKCCMHHDECDLDSQM